MVHDHSFALQKHADAAITEPPSLAGNRLHLFANFRIIRRSIAPDGLGVDTRCPFSSIYNALPGDGTTHACMCERGQACTPDAARYHDPALPCVPQPVAHSVPSALSQKILQRNVVEHRIRQQALELGVLVLERF